VKARPAAPIASEGPRPNASRLAPSLRSKGTGAPSAPKRLVLALIAATCLLGALATNALAAPPTVTIKPAYQVGVTTAKAEGTVDPADHETSYRFEFITDQAFQAQDEQQRLTVSATAGTYTLSFGAQSTSPIAFDAAASELETALNALSTIGGAGGSVTVSGGPGDEAGSAPYTLTFGAALAGTDVEQISADPSALSGGSQSANPETTVEGRPEGFQGANQAGNSSLPAGAGETAVETTLENLQPNTTYHLRLYAENTGVEPIETATATAATFTTKPATAPLLTATPATKVSYLRATLHGSVDPQGGNVNPTGPPGEEALPIYWYLQYREAAPEGGWATGGEGTIEGAKAESSGPIPVEATLPPNALQPAKTYEVRVFAYYLSFSREASSPEPFPSFETLPVAKPIATIEAVTTFDAHTAQLIGHVNPNAPKPKAEADAAEQEAFATHWHFQCEPECPGLEGELVADNTANKVSKEATGLTPGHPYSVVLVAENAGGKETAGPVEFTTEAQPPSVDVTFAAAVSETAATLGAKVNPGGAETTVHFDYTTTDFSSCTPTGPNCFTTSESTSIGKDAEDHTVEATITGLAPNTAYRYRVVATNEKSAGTPGPTKGFHTAAAASVAAGCPNEALRRENNSTALPDCRAYEQVSPVDKGGFDAVPRFTILQYPAQASTDGEGIAYMGNGSFPMALGSGLPDARISARSPTGWSTTEITPPTPQTPTPGGTPLGFDFAEDLSLFAVKVPKQILTKNAPAGAELLNNLYIGDTAGNYSLVNSAAIESPPPSDCEKLFGENCMIFYDTAVFAGASHDFSHLLFEADDRLQGTGAPGHLFLGNLYEKFDGQVRLVGILPDGVVASQGSAPGQGGAQLSGVLYSAVSANSWLNVKHAISADGSRVVFSAASDEGIKPAEASQAGLTEVYDRIEGTQTIELSAPAPGAKPENPAPAPATFWAASKDGSRVFFSSAAELTTASHTGTEGGEDLYEYDFSRRHGRHLTDLTAGADPTAGAGLLGVVSASDDGSYVYFVARGDLSGEAENEAGEVASAGRPNLYVSHEGGAPVFIATLGGGDEHVWTPIPSERQAYLAPDGRHLAFMSRERLTGYDNTDQKTAAADTEVYEYSAARGEEQATLICPSCDPTGAQPIGGAFIGAQPEHLASTPFHQPRVLSDSGGELFFSSPDRLSKGANAAAAMIYEYQQAGTGVCAQQGGCISLISSGSNPTNDVFLDAGADGRNVFFATVSPLTPGDQDGLNDVYDARVNGGFPVKPLPPLCEGEGCAGPPSAPLPSPSRPTNVFAGPEEGPRHPRKPHRPKHRHHIKKPHKRHPSNTRRIGR
jgi:hypothetical protein